MALLIVFFGAWLSALAAPAVARLARPAAGLLLAAVPAALGAVLLLSAPGLGAPGPMSAEVAWAPSLGLSVSLRLDGLAALFAVLIAGVGALVLIYAGGYLRNHAQLGRFLALLLLFMAAMLGIVLADNLLLLYVCWELTTVSSWLLIGFEHERPEARRAAWQSLMVTSAGGLALLAGFVLMGQSAGTYEISALLERGEQIRAGPLYLPILLLVLAGAATKSALVPLHFWLPNAMEAPTPVSAYLHSAAMVKAGIYLLARFAPVLDQTPAWTLALTLIGALTAAVAAWMALMQTDIKRLLAYTTISALGLMVLALGIGGPHGARAALALLLGHGLYKGALFMVAGGLDHGAHSRDLRQLRGLMRAMPWTAAAGLLAMASMVGLPPTLGFIGEEALLETAHRHAGLAVLIAALLAGTLYTAAGFVVGLRPFVGRQRSPEPAHEPGWRLWLPPLVLAVIGIGLALFPGALDRALLAPATATVAGRTPAEALKLWHGINLAFVLGMAMLAVGGGLFLIWDRLRTTAGALAGLRRLGPDRGYLALEAGLNKLAIRAERWMQHGYLPAYLIIVVLTALALAGPPLLRAGLDLPGMQASVRWYDPVLIGVMLAAALGAVFMPSRLAAVLCMSIVGYAVAVFFAIYGAPDLAITQVLVETLLTVLIVLLLPAIPRYRPRPGPAAWGFNGAVCLAAGTLVAGLLMTAGAGGGEGAAGDFYRAQAADEGGDVNIVNMILVNFRAMDTLGEITVLSAAAVGVMVLLGPPHRRSDRTPRTDSQILAIAVRVLLPLLIVFALYLLLTGHHRPGGGFAAALVLTVALGLHLLGGTRSRGREMLYLAPRALMALGLLTVLVSGIIGLIRGEPFLTAADLPWKLTLLEGLTLGTPLLFDAGICLVAAGAVFSILRALERQLRWRS